MNQIPSTYLAPSAQGRVDARTGNRLVVATRRIDPDELLTVFGGAAIDGAALQRHGPRSIRSTLQVDEDLYLLSTRDGPGDWINHSCDPNAGLRGQVVLVARRSILAGEEITFDYAMADGTPYDEFECRCGAPCCRGRVRGTDWRLPELWHRYAGYFSPYLQRRIEALQAELELPRAADLAGWRRPDRRTARPR